VEPKNGANGANGAVETQRNQNGADASSKTVLNRSRNGVKLKPMCPFVGSIGSINGLKLRGGLDPVPLTHRNLHASCDEEKSKKKQPLSFC